MPRSISRRRCPAAEAARGFTLVELLIVVGIVGALAAIAVPGLLRARLSSHEASGLAALRTISSSQANYAATCGAGGFATDLADLARPSPGSTVGFIGPDLSLNGVEKNGYTFAVARNGAPDTVDVLTATCNAAAQPRASAFYANAEPSAVGSTGRRYFATDTPGTIYSELSAIANPIPAGTSTLE